MDDEWKMSMCHDTPLMVTTGVSTPAWMALKSAADHGARDYTLQPLQKVEACEYLCQEGHLAGAEPDKIDEFARCIQCVHQDFDHALKSGMSPAREVDFLAESSIPVGVVIDGNSGHWLALKGRLLDVSPPGRANGERIPGEWLTHQPTPATSLLMFDNAWFEGFDLACRWLMGHATESEKQVLRLAACSEPRRLIALWQLDAGPLWRDLGWDGSDRWPCKGRETILRRRFSGKSASAAFAVLLFQLLQRALLKAA